MKETFKNTLSDFGTKTTLHGIGNTVTQGPTLRHRIVWIIIMLMIYIGFVIVMIYYAVQYYKFEFILTTKIINDKEQNIPSITICNNNIFSRRLVTELYPVTDVRIRAFYSGDIADLSNFTDEQISAEDSTPFVQFAHDTAYSVDDMIVSCKSSLRLRYARNCSQFASHYLTDMGGVCYTLFSHEIIKQFGQNTTHHSGLTASMVITLNVQSEDYYFPTLGGEGMRLFVHSPTTLPYMDRKSVLISPGTSTTIGLKRVSV